MLHNSNKSLWKSFGFVNDMLTQTHVHAQSERLCLNFDSASELVLANAVGSKCLALSLTVYLSLSSTLLHFSSLFPLRQAVNPHPPALE